MFAKDAKHRRMLAAVLAFAAPAFLLTACNDDPLFELPPNAPTNVTAAVQGTSVTIGWTPGPGATSQEVRVSPVVAVPLDMGMVLLVQEDIVQTFNDNTTNSATFTDLEAGAYTATVTAINGEQRTPSEVEPFTIAGSVTAPVITSVALSESDPTTVIVEWTGVEGAENYQVSLTADDDTGDFSDIAAASATSFPFSPVNPGTTYTAEVCLYTQGGGVGECSSTVDYTVPMNAAPVAEITAPADASEFFNTEMITFTGTGTDAEDGNLTGGLLDWSSDVDGPLGEGEELVADASTLTLGAHTITLTATDTEGATGEATIGITIVEATSTISFASTIQPFYVDNGCTSCHEAGGIAESIPLDTYDAIVYGENSADPAEPLIVIGDPTGGVLIPQLGSSHGGGPYDTFVADSFSPWVEDGAPNN